MLRPVSDFEKHLHLVRDVKVLRPAWSRDHIFGLGLGLIVVGLDLGLGLMKCRSRSHGSWLVSKSLTAVDDYSNYLARMSDSLLEELVFLKCNDC